MSRLALPVVLLCALAARPARAGELEQVAEQLGRALVLVAVDQGPAAACELAGPGLTPGLQRLLEAAAANPRAADIRQLGDELELKAPLLAALLNEAPSAREELQRLRAGGAALERDLTQLDAWIAEVCLDVESLRNDLPRVASLKEVRARKRGPRLLLLGFQAPLLRHRTRAELAPPERIAAATRIFDRRPEPSALAALALVARLDEHPAWRAVGGAAGLRQALHTRCGDLVERLRAACEQAQQALADVRTRELGAVVAGKRGPALEEVVPQVTAFRKAFGALPDLRADPLEGVYWDRNDGRAYFWLGEEWTRGSPRVDPIEPIVARLLAASDPALVVQATRPHALARLYGLFPMPFAEGMSSFVDDRAGRLARRLGVLLERIAPELCPAALAALAERTGVPTPLLADKDPRPAGDQVLRAALERGVPAARTLSEGLAAAVVRIEQVRLGLYGVEVEGLPRNVPVDLRWDPPLPALGRTSPTWLIPPPDRLQPGAPVWGVALLPAEVEVTAYALDGRTVLRGAAKLVAALKRRATPLSLAPGEPGLDQRELGPGRVAARSLPLEAPPLELWATDPRGAARPLAPGGLLELGGRDPAGTWELTGRDAGGQVVARRRLTLAARAAVVLAGDAPNWRTAPGGAVEAAVEEGGAARTDAVRWTLSDGRGGVVAQTTGPRFQAKVAEPGRYLLEAEPAEGEATAPIAPASFGVSAREPQVVAARVPWGPAAAIEAGEGCFLRVDAWPALLAEEVLEARWSVGEGKDARKARVLPHPARPASALRLPVHLRPEAAAGARPVTVELVTARGTLRVSGSLRVERAGRAVEVERWRGGEVLALGGAGAQLRVDPSLREVSWTLTGPAGTARRLSGRPDGSVEVALGPDDDEGPYEVWVAAKDRAGQRVFGRSALRGAAVAPLALAAPRRAVLGQKLRLAVAPPRGFEGPFQVRQAGAEWQQGHTLELEVHASNDLSVELRDADGRLATGKVSFPGAPPQGVRGPRYGIACDTKARRIFAAEYSLLESYIQRGALPPTWAILEKGPLTADGARERIFLTVPYDGPGDGAQVAYRSQRFWQKLQATAKARLQELGVAENTPYAVSNTPSPQGEETLLDEVARVLGAEGGWTFRRVGVRVRGDGTEPLREGEEVDARVEVHLVRRSVDQRGLDVDRVEVPGLLADLSCALGLPDELALDRSHRLVFSATALRKALVPRRPYPGGWEQLAPRARLCPQLELSLELGRPGEKAQRALVSSVRQLGDQVAGADLVLWLEHLGTARSPLAGGAPRASERWRLHLQPQGAAEEVEDLSFAPIPPGLLANVPERLSLTLRVRQRRAIPAAKWPADREQPGEPVELGGERYYLEQVGAAETALEVRVVYERRPAGGPPVSPPEDVAGGKAALGALRAGGEAVDRVPVEELLEAAEQDLEAQRTDAAVAAARRAIQRDALAAPAWALLADLDLSAQRLPLAEQRAELALGLAEDPRACLVLGRVRFLQGRFDEAARAARRGLAAGAKGRVKERLEALQLEAQ
ncbi:MAG: hypothetical protein AB7N76_28160 [Planctomycetota bacterium]